MTQVAAVLGDEFGGFQAVGGEFHAIAILFQHAADEFADADGVVGDDDDAFLLDAVDGFAGNRAASDGRRNLARRRERRWRWPGGRRSFGSDGDHAVEIDQQNQAAIGRDGGAGEELHAAQDIRRDF